MLDGDNGIFVLDFLWYGGERGSDLLFSFFFLLLLGMLLLFCLLVLLMLAGVGGFLRAGEELGGDGGRWGGRGKGERGGGDDVLVIYPK